MKALEKFLAGVAIVVVALLAYLILGSGLTVTMEMEIAPASLSYFNRSALQERIVILQGLFYCWTVTWPVTFAAQGKFLDEKVRFNLQLTSGLLRSSLSR